MEQSIAKWQNQSDRTTKGQATKQFFPVIKDRLTNKIKLTLKFTATVTAHGKNKAYLYRFKIIVSKMSMQQRESNSGTLTVRMNKTTNGEGATHTQHFKTRQVASEQK